MVSAFFKLGLYALPAVLRTINEKTSVLEGTNILKYSGVEEFIFASSSIKTSLISSLKAGWKHRSKQCIDGIDTVDKTYLLFPNVEDHKFDDISIFHLLWFLTQTISFCLITLLIWFMVVISQILQQWSVKNQCASYSKEDIRPQ